MELRPRLIRNCRLSANCDEGAAALVVPEGAIRLNESATRIVRLCDGAHTVSQIIAELEASLPASAAGRERIAVDVVELLTQLRARRVLDLE